MFIALAPYLIPAYSILVALTYVIFGWFIDVRSYATWFYATLGASLAFHFAFTAEFLKTQQPDLVQNGRFLSMIIIYWVNLTLVAVCVAVVTPTMHFWDYLSDGYLRSAWIYQALNRQLFF